MTDIPSTFSALVASRQDDGITTAVHDLTPADLPTGEVTVRVAYSGANYKDALALRADGRIVRDYPIVPGIDLAGEVIASTAAGVAVGATVVAHGGAIGTGTHGGYAEYARVPADSVTVLDGITARDAAAIGTAGFTAALSVEAVLAHGITPGDGPVLVTGAGGGVGSVAVDLLAGRGFEVVASTGRAENTDLLERLGAARVIGRLVEEDAPLRPLGKAVWAATVDSVGGRTLAAALAATAYGGMVAASGLTGGSDLPTTVMPFILRGVTLRGIDSVQLPGDRRRALWARLATDLAPAHLDDLVTEVAVTEAPEVLARLIAGDHRGRTVVRVAGAF